MSTHVVFLTGFLGIGGVEWNQLLLVAGLPDRFAVTIAADSLDPEFTRALEATGRPVRIVKVPRPSRNDPAAFLRLARRFRQLGADIVHTHDARSRLHGHPAARLSGAKAVHTFHLPPLYYELSPAKALFYTAVERAYRRSASGYIFVSSHERELYVRRKLVPPERAVVIHNSVDPTEYEDVNQRQPALRRAVRERIGVPDDAVLATFVGRIDPQKGLDYLVAAAPRALAAAPSLHFAIAGDGEQRALLAAAAEREAPGRFRFLGFLNRPAVFELLAASDFFVLPSRFETFPYATLEAAAVGLPCLVTDVGGNTEAVQDGENGLVVPPGDVAGLAEALAELAIDPDRRAAMSVRARAVAARFSAGRMVAATGAVYDAVLSGTPLPTSVAP